MSLLLCSKLLRCSHPGKTHRVGGPFFDLPVKHFGQSAASTKQAAALLLRTRHEYFVGVRCCSGNVIDRAQQKKNVPQAKSIVTPVKQELVVAGITGGKPSQQKRNCFHPGASSLSRESLNLNSGPDVTPKDMVKAMFNFIWPKDEPEIRNRVKLALGLLIGAKVLNVSVPFLFKYAIDTFNAGAGAGALTTAPGTVGTVGTALLVGC